MRLDVNEMIRMLATELPELALDADSLIAELEGVDESAKHVELKRFVDPSKEHMANRTEVDLIHFIQDARAYINSPIEYPREFNSDSIKYLPAPLVAELHMLIADSYSQGVRSAVRATVMLLNGTPI